MIEKKRALFLEIFDVDTCHRIFSRKNRTFFENFLFRFFFGKQKSHRKKEFSKKYFRFYLFIISHAQPMQVASRNSPCAARERGKRTPLNPKYQEKSHILGSLMIQLTVGFPFKKVMLSILRSRTQLSTN